MNCISSNYKKKEVENVRCLKENYKTIVMTNLNCQFDGIQDNHRNKSRLLSLKNYLD